MAEFVQLRCEEKMPELEYMAKLKLFDKDEIRAIAKNRRDHEYKIQRGLKSKDDFLRYIQYEMDLLKLIRMKREKMGVQTKKIELEIAMAHRIIQLFVQMLLRYKEDVKIWLSYIKFCKQERMYGRVSNMLERMLRAHSDKPKMYKLAANWEFEEGGSIEKARQYLQKGIRIHPESEMLYTQAFRLELLNAQMLRKKEPVCTVTSEAGPSTQSSPPMMHLSPGKNIPILAGSQPSADHEHHTDDQEMQYDDPQQDTAQNQKEVSEPQSDGETNKDEEMQQAEQQQQDHHQTQSSAPQLEEHHEEEEEEEPQLPHHQPQQLITGEQDKVKEGRLAEVIYESATKKIRTAEFIISLLSIATDFDFTRHLQTRIVNDLLSFFPNDELTWDIMARRELEGFSYASVAGIDTSATGAVCATPQVNRAASVPSTSNKPHIPTREQIKLCRDVYDAAVKQINTERMWTMYMEAMLELNQDTDYLPRYKRNLLLKALQAAHNAGCLQEKFYLQWVEMLQQMKKDKRVSGILKSATERLNSVELFALRLRYYLAKDDDKQGQQVFEQAVAKLGDTQPALMLWKIMLQYYQLKNQSRVEQIFLQGLVRGPEISSALKPMYLEWIVLSKGIASARKAYDCVSMQPPFCLELHTKMIELEGLQPDQNVKQERKCFELACDQFGRTNADVWIEYVKFEIQKGSAVNMTSIYWRATKSLEQNQSDIFISEYSLLKSSMP